MTFFPQNERPHISHVSPPVSDDMNAKQNDAKTEDANTKSKDVLMKFREGITRVFTSLGEGFKGVGMGIQRSYQESRAVGRADRLTTYITDKSNRNEGIIELGQKLRKIADKTKGDSEREFCLQVMKSDDFNPVEKQLAKDYMLLKTRPDKTTTKVSEAVLDSSIVSPPSSNKRGMERKMEDAIRKHGKREMDTSFLNRGEVIAALKSGEKSTYPYSGAALDTRLDEAVKEKHRQKMIGCTDRIIKSFDGELSEEGQKEIRNYVLERFILDQNDPKKANFNKDELAKSFFKNFKLDANDFLAFREDYNAWVQAQTPGAKNSVDSNISNESQSKKTRITRGEDEFFTGAFEPGGQIIGSNGPIKPSVGPVLPNQPQKLPEIPKDNK